MASITLLLPAVIQGWRAGTQWHSPAPSYHGETPSLPSPQQTRPPEPSCSVCLRQGFDVGHVRSGPLRISWLTHGGTLNGFPCLWFLCREENTSSHYNRLSCWSSVWRHSHLWLGLRDGRRDVWNISVRGLEAGQQLRETEGVGQL